MIVTCGEALVDLVPATVGGEALYRPVLGGSLYTVALGIAQLGGRSGYLWELSRDDRGRRLLAALEAAGVDVSAVRVGARATPVAVVDMSGPEPRYAIADPDGVMVDTDLPALPAATRALHVGSAVLAREPVAAVIEARARDAPLVTIDYNARQPSILDGRAYRERLRRIAVRAGVVKASVADLAILGENDPEGYMRALVRAGAAIAVLTEGADGARAFTARCEAAAPSRACAVVDPVGAGDSFMAALLFRLQAEGALSRVALCGFDRHDLAALLDYAQSAAAFTCARPGAAMPCAADLAAPL